MERRQEGQHFLVSGAGTGIGRAIARRLVTEGAHVTVVGRRANLLEMVQEEAPGQITARAVDIRDTAALERAAAESVEQYGRFRGVICNAGIGGPNAAGSEDRFFEIVETNLVGTYRTIRATEPHLAAGPEARHFVITSSILARFGVPGYTGYCAAKAGLLGLVRALAHELAPSNVQVNALCPGWVATEMAWKGIDAYGAARGLDREAAFQDQMQHVPLGRMSEPEDVAGLVAWLVSTDARGVTGQALDMNNGAWMG
jgi:NAD(P)-dependent dehydrogenase (short-subunit alcohol dehydrogenase family)